LRSKYLEFYASHGHQIVPSAPLVPENDPSTLFTGSGMQPMVPYLLGQPHPLGTRLVDSQKCFRSQDIEEVGDNRHDSFFEMLGNWSLGDYFKKEQLTWLFELLTKEFGLPKNKLWVTVFAGDDIIPKDDEAAGLWKDLGIPEDHIKFYDETKNWWSRAGIKANMPVGEPGGPDSEVFYDFGAELKLHENSPFKDSPCHPNCDCGRFLEIGNSVFMTYKKTDSGFVPLEKKNIDFGGGFERLLSALNNDPDQFLTDLYEPIISQIEKLTNNKYSENKFSMRIIADHLKASTFLIADGVLPSNKAQGYFLRRLLRRAIVKIQKLNPDNTDTSLYSRLVETVVEIYKSAYPSLLEKQSHIISTITAEHNRFVHTLAKGLREFNKLNSVDGKAAFDLFQTYGFPLEVTMELASEKGQVVDKSQFASEFEKHQELSRTASKGMFKGGLQDHSEVVTKYHTATHLLHKALRDVLGPHVGQKGSNITAERLRFDFSHGEKLTPEQIQRVEEIMNEKISANLTVTRQEMPKKQALAEGALAFFPEKYPDITSVYTIGPLDNWYSKELCGGPHVSSTGEIGKIKIIKEESAGAGIRRIYAQLDSESKN
jgi:alanyl-tRNA synthetase